MLNFVCFTQVQQVQHIQALLHVKLDMNQIMQHTIPGAGFDSLKVGKYLKTQYSTLFS